MLLAKLTFHEGDCRESLRLFHEGLPIISELSSRWQLMNSVANAVALAALGGEHYHAARLAAYVTASSDYIGAVPIPLAEATLRDGLELIHLTLIHAEVAEAMSAGKRMTLNEAIVEARDVAESIGA